MHDSEINYLILFTDTIPEYCKAHPTAVLPKGDNCGQYYNCSVGLTRYGRNVLECPYPDLFSSTTNRCERFTTVSCKARPEHQAPCKSYLRKYFDNSINYGIKFWFISLLFCYC